MPVRAISIHGHFYQPPREDPITGLIPNEHGAEPYSNWNERIHAECYQPNIALGNFEHISFNLGPTLTSWMRGYDPRSSQLIAAQDATNVRQHGVGNAMAQAYHHAILPLATREDKITEVQWGAVDFEQQFGHKPAGMWLPETAVDLETLDVLAENGIEFTILAPWQADTDDMDVTEPYRVALPSGRSITVFFYHQGLSTGVSFSPDLTTNADEFVRNLVLPAYAATKEHSHEPQMLLIASDGELYGHHQSYRDRFLAHLVNGASTGVGLEKSYPALWLRQNPAKKWTGIQENTSWSCHHGVERWRDDCDCTMGDGQWKHHLRRAYDQLAERIDAIYSATLERHQINAWKLRNQYIHVLLGHLPVNELICQGAGKRLDEIEVRQIGLLLKAERERLRMFASCGWFFDDFSRIEPRNSAAYAAHAIRLTQAATGIDLTALTMADMSKVSSQQTGLRGDTVLQRELQKTVPAGLFN